MLLTLCNKREERAPLTGRCNTCFINSCFTNLSKILSLELYFKVVIITGASSGLGEALAHVFYDCGCKVILISRRKDELERVKNALINSHVVCLICINHTQFVSNNRIDYFISFQTVPTYPPVVMPLDITNINSLQTEITKMTDIHGKVDILINNAGISFRGDVLSTNVDVDIKVMLTNYFAQIALAKGSYLCNKSSLKHFQLCCKNKMFIVTAVLPHMVKQQSGHIVCISSIQGRISIPYRLEYFLRTFNQIFTSSCLLQISQLLLPGRRMLHLNMLCKPGAIVVEQNWLNKI